LHPAPPIQTTESTIITSKLNEILAREVRGLKTQSAVNPILQKQLDDIISKLDKLPHHLSAEEKKEEVQTTQNMKAKRAEDIRKEQEPRINAVKTTRSIEKIMEYLPNMRYHYENVDSKENDQPDGLYCSDCLKEENSDVSSSQKGVVHYDFTKGESFNKAKTLPQEFSNLKKKVISHMETDQHLQNHDMRIRAEEWASRPEFIKRNQQIGRTLARNALKAITENQSQLSYEMECAIDSAKGIDIGQLNHSFNFASSMTTPFYEVLRDEIRQQLNEPLPGTNRLSPVSAILDKYTPYRRTVDIIGANAYVGGKIETLYADGDLVKDHSGKGIGESVSNALDRLYGNEEWKQR